MPSLIAENLHKTYRSSSGTVEALRDVSLEVSPGSCAVVYGPSGSGKTTLLLSLAGMLRPDQGSVACGNRRIDRLSASGRREWWRNDVGFVFQNFLLVPFLSAVENIRLALGTTKSHSRAEELLDRVGLAGRRNALPKALSAGEQQRVAIARALANEPTFLFADEPTGNLDAESAELALGLFSEFRSAGGAVLIVSHQPSVREFADSLHELRAGTF